MTLNRDNIATFKCDALFNVMPQMISRDVEFAAKEVTLTKHRHSPYTVEVDLRATADIPDELLQRTNNFYNEVKELFRHEWVAARVMDPACLKLSYRVFY